MNNSVSEEYKAIKAGTKPNKKLGIEGQTQDIKQKILGSDYTRATKKNIIRIYDEVGTSFLLAKNEKILILANRISIIDIHY